LYPGVEEALTCELGGQSTARAGEQLKLGIPADCSHLFDANGRAFRRHYRMPAQRAA
jgi:multiple sugar transport system ATP-binding protein